jgi:energy-converting hydrogenase Eha subunit A
MAEGVTHLTFLLALSVAVLVGMSLLAYVLLTRMSPPRASFALWCILATSFLCAPIAAITRGGWWWLAPCLAAVSVGLLGAAQRPLER